MLKLCVLLIFLVSIGYCDVCTAIFNSNRAYYDYFHDGNNTDPNYCCQLCGGDFHCVSWAIVNAGYVNAGCYKKYTIPQMDYSCTWCIWGIKDFVPHCKGGFEESTNRVGPSINRIPLDTGPGACCMTCEADLNCRSWTFTHDEVGSLFGVCWLYDNIPGISWTITGPQYTSGIKNIEDCDPSESLEALANYAVPFLARNEGFSSLCYKIAGDMTIGFGIDITQNPHFLQEFYSSSTVQDILDDKSEITFDDSKLLTQQFLLNFTIPYIKRKFLEFDTFPQPVQVALIDITYNMGHIPSQLLPLIRERDWEATADALEQTKWAQSHACRSQKDVDMIRNRSQWCGSQPQLNEVGHLKANPCNPVEHPDKIETVVYQLANIPPYISDNC